MPLEHYVLELAVLKAKAIAEKHPNAIVIGADTALILGRNVIGKPGTLAAARRMLALLGGRKHLISSAVCIIFPKRTPGGKSRILKVVDTAQVTLRKWSPARIQMHVALTRPLSWAGAYAVQDPFSAAIVERIDGDLATVIGLPWAKLEKVFRSQNSEVRIKEKGMKRYHSMPSN
jgi:septum formation protein